MTTTLISTYDLTMILWYNTDCVIQSERLWSAEIYNVSQYSLEISNIILRSYHSNLVHI